MYSKEMLKVKELIEIINKWSKRTFYMERLFRPTRKKPNEGKIGYEKPYLGRGNQYFMA